jgi:hypothetical protein
MHTRGSYGSAETILAYGIARIGSGTQARVSTSSVSAYILGEQRA